ncbi:MAG: hypothetical protein KGV46_02630 [Pasteurella sp.]|nr:hypothetical protein [Pasteurella sp.]
MKKKLIKPIVLATLLSVSVTGSYASGIPVVDAANNLQNKLHYAKELIEMGKQLVTAKHQLEQLTSQLEAITGNKGFVDVLNTGGLETEILDSFDDLLNGTTTTVSNENKKLIGDFDCSRSKSDEDKMLCESSALSLASDLDNIKKLSNQFDEKIKRINELSQKVQSAKDTKSMAEIQAAISLEANSLAVLEQQRKSFKDLLATREKVYMQRVIRQHSAEKMQQYLKDKKGGNKRNNYNAVLGN